MLDVERLTYRYQARPGPVTAVEDLSFSVAPGDICGLVGPNGAGKTTTMRILATLLNPTWGVASVCGYSIYTHPKEIRRLIGYMPDFFGVYDDMKVIEYLEFFAAAYRIKGAQRKKVCDEVLDLVDLGYKREAFVTSLSRGMTQRLGLARVLLHDPQVLLLDEPASGLDPRARIEIRGLLKELRKMGKTIMVSSHILPELADICNKIGIIERGELLVNADVAEVMRQVRQQTVLQIVVAADPDGAARVLERQPIVEKVDVSTAGIQVTLIRPDSPAALGWDGDYSGLAAALVQAGYKLKTFREEELNLETAFMVLTKGITA